MTTPINPPNSDSLFVPPGAPIPPPVAPKSTSRKVRRIISIVVLVVALGLGVFGYLSSRKSAQNAKVGDCLDAKAASSIVASDASGTKIVACTSAEAKFTVIGKIDNKSSQAFESDDHICDAFPEWTAAYWWGPAKAGALGSVLCLKDK